MRIAVASDHAGFEYKERLKLFLVECGHAVVDFGADSDAPVDYPLVIRPLAEAVAADEFDRGVIIGGSGNGEAIVANRVHGVRCTLCWNLASARWARQHNDANILSLGQRLLEFDEAQAIVECWLETSFEGGRHRRRVRQIDRPPHASPAEGGPLRLPHRAELVDEAGFHCNSCREPFQFPVDISAGSRQEFVEECPVCCHENPVVVHIDEEGRVTVSANLSITG